MYVQCFFAPCNKLEYMQTTHIMVRYLYNNFVVYYVLLFAKVHESTVHSLVLSLH